MDWTKAPAEMRPEHLYSAVSFDAVNTVFRDGKVFNSHIYDSTIGLFIGPTILAMEGKKHWEHRNLVSAAFKSKSLLRWEPEVVRPVVNALIDEFVDAGAADLVRDFTLEFPTRVISKLLGLTRGGPAMVPQARGRIDQLPRQVEAGIRGIVGAEGLLPATDRASVGPSRPRTSSAIS